MRRTLRKTMGSFLLAFIALPGLAQTSLPYSISLGESQEGWKALDASTVAGTTWTPGEFYEYNSGSYINGVTTPIDWDYSWNDYYISPAFNLEAGKNYKVKTRSWRNNEPSAFTLTLKAGTSDSDASTFQTISGLSMQYTYDANATEDHVFAVKTSGTYYLAFLATASGITNEKIALTYFDLEETNETAEVTIGDNGDTPPVTEETKELPYYQSFAFETTDWSVLDANNSGKTWSHDSNWGYYCGGYNPCYLLESDVNADDYFVSPAFKFEAGKTYTIALTSGHRSYSGTLDLQLGTNKSDASTFNKLMDITGDADTKLESSYELTVDETGVYYLALHATTEGATENGPYQYLLDFGVTAKESVEPEVPLAVPYSVTFNSSDIANTWTAIDNSSEKDIESWRFNEYAYYDGSTNYPGVSFNGDWAAPADDYFVSPALALEAGKTYKVSANTSLRYDDSNMKLSFVYGTSKTDASTYNEVGDIASGVTYDANRSDESTFTVPTTGTYYVGIHGVSPEDATAQAQWQLSKAGIFNFAIEEIETKEDTLDVPYAVTFDANNVNTWYALDNSEVPGVTWAWNGTGYQEKDAENNNVGEPHSCVSLKTDNNSAACDYFYSPALRLKEGKSYKVKFHIAASSTNEMNLQLVYTQDRKNPNEFNQFDWLSPSSLHSSYDATDSTYTVEISKDGIYYFGVKALSWEAGTETDVNVFSFSIEEKVEEAEVAQELPYSIDFTQYETQETEWGGTEGVDPSSAWTALDRSNNPSSTWRWSSYGYQEYDDNWQTIGECHAAVSYNSDWSSNANDYFVSPAFDLKEGKVYQVKATVTCNRTCLEAGTTNITLEVGNQKKIAGSYTAFATIPLHTEYESTYNDVAYEFTADADGLHWVALHIADETGQNAYGYFMQFSIEEKVAPAAEAVTELTAVEDASTKSVTLTWKNPTTDTQGNALAEDAALTVKVYEGEELLTTLEGQLPGANGTYTYEPATYEGVHNYKVVVVYNEQDSEPAETSLEIINTGIKNVDIPANATVTVHSLNGALVSRSADLSNLEKGVYIITIRDAQGNVKTSKITK